MMTHLIFSLFFLIPVLFNTDDVQPFILLSDRSDEDEPGKDLGSCTECFTNGIDVTFPLRRKTHKSRENKMEAGLVSHSPPRFTTENYSASAHNRMN